MNGIFNLMTRLYKRSGLTLACLMLLPLWAYAATPNLYTVKTQTISKTLYYAGTVSPLVSIPVISPTQGVISQMDFAYGQLVTKDQVLFHIKSSKIEDTLRDAQAAYLDALQTYNKKKHWQTSDDVLNAQDSLQRAQRALSQAESTYQENQNLYKLQIISHDDLVQSENAYQDSQSSYAQAKRALDEILSQDQGDELTIAHLRMLNAKEKYISLQKQMKDNIILSPASGVILEPDASSSSSDTSGSKSSGKLQVGSSISYQQVLLTIGNLSGLKINFQVPEINVNQLRTGQPASITGAGFPGITLSGTVTSVGAQASSSGNSSVPSFPVEVKVPSLTPTQQQAIRSGMDAQIAVTISTQSNSLEVPINAVSRNAQGQAVVAVYDPTTKNTTPTIITTGIININNVQVLSGLKIGQQIVLPSS